jgi:hypothetical protein
VDAAVRPGPSLPSCEESSEDCSSGADLRLRFRDGRENCTRMVAGCECCDVDECVMGRAKSGIVDVDVEVLVG